MPAPTPLVPTPTSPAFATTSLVIHTATDSSLSHLIPLILVTSTPPPSNQLKMLKFIDSHPNHKQADLLPHYRLNPDVSPPFGVRPLTKADLALIATHPGLSLPITTGWLRKKGNTRRAWSNRSFSVHGGYLFYAKEEGGDVVGCIPLVHAKINLPPNDAANFNDHANQDVRFGYEFAIATAKRTYTLIASTPVLRTSWVTTMNTLIDFYQTSATALQTTLSGAHASENTGATLTQFSSTSFNPGDYIDNFFATNPTSHTSHTISKLNACHTAATDLIRDVVVSQHPSFILAGQVARAAANDLSKARANVESLVATVDAMRDIDFDADEADYDDLKGGDSSDSDGSGSDSDSDTASSVDDGGKSSTDVDTGSEDAALESIEGHIVRTEMASAVEKIVSLEITERVKKVRDTIAQWLQESLDLRYRRAAAPSSSSSSHLFVSPTCLSDDIPSIGLLLQLDLPRVACNYYCKRRSLLINYVKHAPVPLAHQRLHAVTVRSVGFFTTLAQCVVEFTALCVKHLSAGTATPSKLVLWVDEELAGFVKTLFDEHLLAGPADEAGREEKRMELRKALDDAAKRGDKAGEKVASKRLERLEGTADDVHVVAKCLTVVLEQAAARMGDVGCPVVSRVAGLFKKHGKVVKEAKGLMDEAWQKLL
jgi:hypothetical protein